MDWLQKIQNKVDLEYELNYSEDLDNSNMSKETKDIFKSVAKNIIVAELLLEDNSLATGKDYQYLEDTKNKYQQVKDKLL